MGGTLYSQEAKRLNKSDFLQPQEAIDSTKATRKCAGTGPMQSEAPGQFLNMLGFKTKQHAHKTHTVTHTYGSLFEETRGYNNSPASA